MLAAAQTTSAWQGELASILESIIPESYNDKFFPFDGD